MRKTIPILRAAAAFLLGVLLFVLPVSAHAAVTSTKEATGPVGTVYVAGTPDMYPLEYYDSQEKCYAGIVPMILELISEETGYDFCYVNAGKDDHQKTMARNQQVEIISAYIPGSGLESYLLDSKLILEATVDGEQQNICIAFTKIASPELIRAVSNSIRNLSKERMAEIIVNYTIGKENVRNQIPLIWTLGISLAVAVAGIIIIFTVMFLRIRRMKDDGLTDKSTNIGNQEYFRQYYDSFLNDQNRGLYYVAYIAFNIRWVNQYQGMDEADHILRNAADCLMNYTRDTDITARITGGAFALAFQCVSPEVAELHLQQLLHLLNRNISDENAHFRAGLYAIGGGNYTCETVLSNAEQGYRRAVRDNLPYVVCTDNLLKELAAERQIVEQTADAVSRGEIRPYLQMLVDTKTNQVCGAEMLSRWQNPKSGLLLPGSYISIMEQGGSIVDLDFFIFEQACKRLEHWAASGWGDFSISCNFSRLTISREDFCARVFEIASRYQFQRDRFILEITEDIMESNKEAALRNAKACKKFGFRLALDDMGSGYTSFMNLCDYPIDVVKVDRFLMMNAVLLERGSIMIDAIVAMAHKMGMTVVCEGVETDAQDAMVKRVGADYIQGYRYSHVIPLEETDDFIRKYHASLAGEGA